ncbi:ADP-sugar diphosphatase [Massariosphaeria phaeospora]|uniref:ADP-sugar diphosphatase n=1 Tax=Massariosphaeria phaeospora TaxID=100035 RepID=A0A7C8IIH9_9PLEO|nr:ADP-sugar diphosphatase [Massariosphaeria phaeospora]
MAESDVVSHSARDIRLTTYVLAKYAAQDDSGHVICFDPPCTITLPPKLELNTLFAFKAFKDWLATLQHNFSLQGKEDHPFHKNPYKLKEIDVQAVTWFGTRVGFLKIQATIETDDDSEGHRQWLPGAVFLRGGSVGMLLIVQGPNDEDEKQVILTIQPRIAAGSLAFTEIPAGMLDNGNITGKAVEEIRQETSLEVVATELTNMSDLAAEQATRPDEKLQSSMYPSPGGCDEFMPIMLCQKRLSEKMMADLSGKLTGLRDEGENITCRLVKLRDLWKEGCRDGKTLVAVALYEKLKEEGSLPAFPTEMAA